MNETEQPEARAIIEVEDHVDAVIENYRGGRLAGSPAARTYIIFSIDSAAHPNLVGLMATNLKQRVTLTIHNISLPLPTEPAEHTKQTLQGRIHFEVNGEPVLAHRFLPNNAVPDYCEICTLHRDLAVHREENFEPMGERREQATEQDAADQAQAMENLRHADDTDGEPAA